MTDARMKSYATLQRLIAVELALHNFEEWLTFPRFGEVTSDMLARLGHPVAAPPWSATQIALALATIVPTIIVFAAAARTSSKRWTWLALWVQAQLGANVLLPHIPAALLARGYSPGIATALIVNLPFTIVFIRRTLREGHLPMRSVASACLAGVIAMPLAILGLVVSGHIAGRLFGVR
jgi:hypothetical protein